MSPPLPADGIARRQRPGGGRLIPSQVVMRRAAPWAAAAVLLLVATAATFSSAGATQQVLALAVGTLVAVWVVRHPGRAVMALVLVMPFQVVLLAAVYSAGAPAALVRAAGSWNELVLVVLFGVAATNVLRERRALETLDRLALAYVGLATVYLVLPPLLRPLVGNLLPLASASTDVLAASFRTNVGFVVLFLSTRHLDLPQATRERILRVVLVVGAIIGALAVAEWLDTTTWQQFFRQTIGVDRFAQEILGTRSNLVGNSRVTGVAEERRRMGSVLFQALTLGFFLLPAMAASMQTWLRRSHSRAVVGLVLTAGGILLTFTRSAVLGAAALLLATIPSLPSRRSTRRQRAAIGSMAAMAAGLWAAASLGLIERFSSGIQGTDPSSEGHIRRSLRGLRIVLEHPLGLGLGSGPTARGQDATIISENAYLQIGLEMGAVTMVVFIVLLFMIVAAAFRLAREANGRLLAGTVATAGLGLIVGGFFLHVWTNLPGSWTFFGLAGLALPALSKDDP